MMEERTCDLLVRNARQLITLRSSEPGPRCGRAMEDLGVVEDGAVAVRTGRIVAVGVTDDVLSEVALSPGCIEIDASGKIVLPGFVDAHTHPIFVGSRDDEFELRIKGATYQEIARRGGGIRATVRKVRQASKQELFEAALPRLDRMLEHGTTTIEAKSGYGLSTEDEIKMLEVVRDLQESHPVDLVPTFLGAHEVPDEYRGKKPEYIELILHEMIPAVAERELAEFCDVFCEEEVFDVEESKLILTAAREAGLEVKLHADELSPFGGAELAAELEALSADHLVAVSDQGIMALKSQGVIAVLLPGTTFSLGCRQYAPARRMITTEVPVALATDMNPGSCRTESMAIIITLACVMMRLTPAEAIAAATLNGACAVAREGAIGSLDIGKKGDIVIWDMPRYSYLPYHFGVNFVEMVIKDGKVVVDKRNKN
ncbi:MAG: imidazolonepropionase [Gemmatimonadota bacterium]|nr:MAG: imidazolonepropionase [Gemmatimonadota bacterium]